MTAPGDPYVARFLSDNGNYKTRDVRRPRIASSYFNAANTIDVHNQIRQNLIQLEQHWLTCDGWFRIATTILGMTVTDTLLTCKFSFPSESTYSKLTTKEFVSALANQLAKFPFAKASSFGKRVVPIGQEPPQWFEHHLIQQSNTFPANGATATTSTTDTVERVVLGKTQLKDGWEAVSNVDPVQKPTGGAPGLPSDLLESHKQVKIKMTRLVDGRRPRPPQCKMCKLYGLKQKKPPFLCVECGDFFCHDTKGLARKCYWNHLCLEFQNSGIPSAIWLSQYKQWNDRRIRDCKEADECSI